MGQFAANNQVSASTKATLFFANYGFHPRFTISLQKPERITPSLDAHDFAQQMKGLHEHLRTQIRTAQDQQGKSVNAYQLDLPKSMKMHPVFHVTLLDFAANDPVTGQRQPPPPPIIVNQEEEYEIEEILDSRRYGR